MQRINEFELYELANHIHPLTEVTQKVKYSAVWFNWFQARTAIQTIFNSRALEVCWKVANELYRAIDDFVPRDFDEAIAKVPAAEDEQELGWASNRIRTAAQNFETIISAELSNSDTYWISPKGTHKTSMLMQYAHMELSSAVLQEVPEVKFDFDEAGRCLHFDTSTATGFHLLRATETVIRRYYKAVNGTEPPNKFRNWGTYVRVLQSNPKANQKIVSSIDRIREHYRNPILHPQDNLTAEDAQVLFGLCVSVITLIVGAIKELAEQTRELPFPAGGIALPAATNP